MHVSSDAVAKKMIKRLKKEAERLANKPVGKASSAEVKHYFDLVAIQKLILKQ